MGKIREWFRNQAMSLAIAVSNTEKNLFSQDGRSLGEDTKQERRHSQGTMVDSLVRGELTEEVKNFRWRMYKILKTMNGIKFKHYTTDDHGDVHTDENGNIIPIFEREIINHKNALDKVVLDSSDSYNIEFVVDNERITVGMFESLQMEDINSATLTGDTEDYNMSSKNYFDSIKTEYPVKITRTFFPKFYIEKFTKKLNVRKIDDTKRLLEFCVNKYPDPFNRTNQLFLVEVKKAMNGAQRLNFLDIDEVGFITNNTLGSNDFLFYEYKVLSFDKISEFDGKYIIKFVAEVTTNGEDILADYVDTELEKKYKANAPRKRRI